MFRLNTTRGLGAAFNWSGGGISSNDLPVSLTDTWQPTDAGGPGYNSNAKCYCWGYRPRGVQVMGVRGLGAVDGDVPSFAVCPQAAGCCTPTVVMKTSPNCPSCPVKCPTYPAPGPSADTGKFGVNIGMLVAAAMVGGVGYYGYKHKWFGKGKR